MQWAHYADKHKELCLGFDIPDHSLAKVNYSEKRLPADEFLAQQDILSDQLEGKMDDFIGQPASPDEFERRKSEFLEEEYPRLLNQHTESDQEGQDFMKEVLTTKAVEWGYEKEYRVFVSLQSCEQVDGLYYKKFSSEDLTLREEITGLRSEVTCKQIEDALGKMTDCVNIRRARMSRSEYALVED